MAHKVEAPAITMAPENELDVLHPERTVTVGSRLVTMREYGFVEGIRLRVVAKPFIATLHELFKAREVPHYEAVQDIIASHIDLVLRMSAQAADVEPEWVEKLSGQDGELLLLMWWGVNGGFFMRAALQRIRVEREMEELLAGAGSTPPLSPTATTSAASENIQNES